MSFCHKTAIPDHSSQTLVLQSLSFASVKAQSSPYRKVEGIHNIHHFPAAGVCAFFCLFCAWIGADVNICILELHPLYMAEVRQGHQGSRLAICNLCSKRKTARTGHLALNLEEESVFDFLQVI